MKFEPCRAHFNRYNFSIFKKPDLRQVFFILGRLCLLICLRLDKPELKNIIIQAILSYPITPHGFRNSYKILCGMVKIGKNMQNYYEFRQFLLTSKINVTTMMDIQDLFLSCSGVGYIADPICFDLGSCSGFGIKDPTRSSRYDFDYFV